jgi:hypothetical protein
MGGEVEAEIKAEDVAVAVAAEARVPAGVGGGVVLEKARVMASMRVPGAEREVYAERRRRRGVRYRWTFFLTSRRGGERERERVGGWS